MIARRDRDFGIVEWFRPGEHERVESSIERLRQIGCDSLRTHLSWAEYHDEGGQSWYDWLLPRLAQEAELLPCVHYTPPSLSETGRSNGPPRDLRAYADFVDHVIDRYGAHFPALELWNEPNNLLDWDWRVDADWLKFCTMVGAAGHWARERGRQVVLGGPCPNDLNWLTLMGERGVLGVVDAIGLHGFPGTWDADNVTWHGWRDLIDAVRGVLDRYNGKAGIWITETGYSSWRLDWRNHVSRFVDALDAQADRVYWYALQDLADDVKIQQGHRFDERHYHLGLYDKRGRPKPLARLLISGGAAAARFAVDPRQGLPAVKKIRPILITGGAGFIGCNLADRLVREGESVLVLDSFARQGVERNAAWLKERHGARISTMLGDLRDHDALAEACRDASAVFHFAAQVAVTSSLDDPLDDFDVNLRGTLLLLEALRKRPLPAPLIFASTNKVYGDLGGLALLEGAETYQPAGAAAAKWGIDEIQPLAFSTPYGCSKGAADQYVCDYAHSYGVPTAVLRMSCVYGPRQFGTEDQGWVAHFLIRALRDEPITVYGNGKQVRDVLYVDDAVDAYIEAWKQVHALDRRAFNLGGGPANAISLLQLLNLIRSEVNPGVAVDFEPWRQGDQRYYVSDTRLVRSTFGLAAPRRWRAGVARLLHWLREEGVGAGSDPGAADTLSYAKVKR